jgi:hypothetical protein
MIYDVHITGVDGETHAHLQTAYAAKALEFLQRFDHEGSSVYLRIDVDDPETIYRLLTTTTTPKNPKK